MKKTIVVMLAILFTSFVYAQSYKSEVSELFDSNIGMPVLVLKDGTTIFQYDDVKERKMVLTIFDKDHKVIVNRKEMNFKKINYVFHFSYQQSTHVKFWMESKGKAKVYFENELKPYYVIIDPKTGNVEEETEIKDVAVGHTMLVNARSKSHVYVVKSEIDFATGNRLKIDQTWKRLSKEEALAKTNFNDIATLNFKIFDAADNELQSADFDFLDHKYQSIDILRYYFNNDVIYFASVMYNITDRRTYDDQVYGKGGTGAVCFSKYDLKTKKFTHKELYELKDDITFDDCNMKFGPGNKTCYIAFFAKVGKEKSKGETKKVYEIIFQSFDAATLTAEKPFSLSNGKLDEFVKANCKMSEGYEGGFVQDFFIDKDNNLMTIKVKNASLGGSGVRTNNPELFGYTFMDKKGTELAANAYRYDVSDVEGAAYINNKLVLSQNNFIYKYFMTSNGIYLLLNNMDDNHNLPLSEKAKTCKAADQTNTKIVSISKGEVKEEYLFGVPADKKQNMHCEFRNVFYDEKSQTVVVTVYEGKKFENARAAWIKLN